MTLIKMMHTHRLSIISLALGTTIGFVSTSTLAAPPVTNFEYDANGGG